MINRIAIIGISASGKSIFARELAAKTGLPLVHMDQLFWQGNWQEVPETEYLKKHQEIIEQEQWIIEGYIEESMVERLKRAELILYLDYPGWLCALRLVRRWLKHRRRARPELPKEALEDLKHETLWKVLTQKERIRIEQALRLAGSAKTIRLKSPKDIREYMKNY
jgi:adenylate kinase family enzyme